MLAIAALALYSSAPYAQDATQACTRDEALAADVVTDYLTTWENVYSFYKQFRHCYDGAIAEGVQDKVQLLWASRWSELPKMLAFTRRDPEFKNFIWNIMDSEAFPQDTFNTVLAHATRRCPKDATEFCQAVKSAAKRPQ